MMSPVRGNREGYSPGLVTMAIQQKEENLNGTEIKVRCWKRHSPRTHLAHRGICAQQPGHKHVHDDDDVHRLFHHRLGRPRRGAGRKLFHDHADLGRRHRPVHRFCGGPYQRKVWKEPPVYDCRKPHSRALQFPDVLGDTESPRGCRENFLVLPDQCRLLHRLHLPVCCDEVGADLHDKRSEAAPFVLRL